MNYNIETAETVKSFLQEVKSKSDQISSILATGMQDALDIVKIYNYSQGELSVALENLPF